MGGSFVRDVIKFRIQCEVGRRQSELSVEGFVSISVSKLRIEGAAGTGGIRSGPRFAIFFTMMETGEVLIVIFLIEHTLS